MNLASQFYTGNAVVYSNGEVLFIPPVKLKVKLEHEAHDNI